MKLLIFIIGIALGGYAVHRYDQHEAAVTDTPPGSGVTVTSSPSGNSLGDSIDDKLRDWHLTGDDIKADLSKTGEVVRANAQVAGARISDARIVAVIKAKYLLDRDLSAVDIAVDVRDGMVVLRGTVASPEFIGRAVGLALDTGGVQRVTARLTVAPK